MDKMKRSTWKRERLFQEHFSIKREYLSKVEYKNWKAYLKWEIFAECNLKSKASKEDISTK